MTTPPRRSTRAASVKPASKAAPKVAEKLTSRSRAKTVAAVASKTKKRVASPERSISPSPAKRSRTTKSENVAPAAVAPAARKPRSRAASVTNKAPAVAKTKKTTPTPQIQPQQILPYLNPLPTAPAPRRPGLQLFAWGAGNFGQFGMGTTILGEISKPRKNAWVEEQMERGTFGADGAGIETIAAGGLHTLFIDEKGTVWSSGVNDDAALGRITADVPDPENPENFLDVDELLAVPHPIQSLVDEGFRAVRVVSGDSICAVISEEGELRVWGSFRANEGSLGFSSGKKHQFIPGPILTLARRPGDYEKVVSVAAGGNHLVVLTTHGNIYTWGAGEQAQLGRKILERRKIHGTVPEKVTLAKSSRKAVIVGAGTYHSFAVDTEGDVWGWGLNNMGQVGTGYEVESDGEVQLPQRVLDLSKEELKGDYVTQIAGGDHHTLFLTAAGKVYACGRSNAGQLGLADDDVAFKDRVHPDFIPIPSLVTFPDASDPIDYISVGTHNNSAISRGGALYAWGQGTQGELGVGDEDEEVKTPRMIVRKEGGSWRAVYVACGGQHTIGLFQKKN